MKPLPPYFEEQLDNIDASVFTGDALYNRGGIERFEYFINRWQKEANKIKEQILEAEVEESQ